MSDLVDDEDELFASGMGHDTDHVEHATKEIHACGHSRNASRVLCIVVDVSNFVDNGDELSASGTRHSINSHEVHVRSIVAVECKMDELTGVILGLLYLAYTYLCVYVYVYECMFL